MKISLEKILLFVIIALVIGILGGTAIIVTQKVKNSDPEVLISKGIAENLAEPQNTDEVDYYNLESLRIMTAADDENSAGTVMVVTPWLAYPKNDTVFYEEIARKKGILKAEFTKYFSSRTKNQILSLGDAKITAELLKILNSELALGQISDIYFTDFIFFE